MSDAYAPEFRSPKDREEWVKAGADYFTVVRYLGPLKGYERHEVSTLAEAEALARRMAEQSGLRYMVYAVRGRSDAFLKWVGEQTVVRSAPGKIKDNAK